jgi:hypothetical protein
LKNKNKKDNANLMENFNNKKGMQLLEKYIDNFCISEMGKNFLVKIYKKKIK